MPITGTAVKRITRNVYTGLVNINGTESAAPFQRTLPANGRRVEVIVQVIGAFAPIITGNETDPIIAISGTNQNGDQLAGGINITTGQTAVLDKDVMNAVVINNVSSQDATVNITEVLLT